MSQIWEYIKIALMNIKSNKGRSVLTMLGIIIGISSVIMIISIGNGMKSQINTELEDMAGGQVALYVNNNNNEDNSDYLAFTEDDMEAIKEKVPHVKGVTPTYGSWGSAVSTRGEFEATIQGGTEAMFYRSKEPMVAGHYFTASDYYGANDVCVIRESSAKTLFGTSDVVGMTVDLVLWGISHEFTIVGVRADSDASLLSAMGAAYTSPVEAEIPVTTMGAAYDYWVEDFSQVIIICDSSQYSTQAAQQAITLLEGRHNIRGQGLIALEDFNDSMAQITSMLSVITMFIVFVAAISLLVGGIGVMNIMLVSVTERTREIGIRKSLGARTGSILLQFLSESAIITLMGGLIGIILGVAGAVAVCSAVGFAPQVKLSTVLGASLFSSAVGIFFGIYPARKAAKLSPIEALRHE